MHNLTDSEQERGKLIQKAQDMLSKGYKASEISSETGLSVRTVYRCRNYDPSGRIERHKPNDLDAPEARAKVIQLIKKGYTLYGIYKVLKNEGMHISRIKLEDVARELAFEEGLVICTWHKGPDAEDRKKYASPVKSVTITRHEIMEYLWSGTPLKLEDTNSLYERYPNIFILKECIEEFHYIFNKRSMPSLYLFIEKYKTCSLAPLKSFAVNLEKDISAVENAVASDYSNGFIEGTNNKIKTVKRSMYGRCSARLLKAKLMYDKESG